MIVQLTNGEAFWYWFKRVGEIFRVVLFMRNLDNESSYGTLKIMI